MAYFEHNSEAMTSLEGMVDRVGVANVLYALAVIARDKSDHLAANWQDYSAAAIWGRTAERIETLATKVQV